MKICLFLSVFSLFITKGVCAQIDKITKNGNDIVINNTKVYKNILSQSQNNNVFLSEFNDKQALERTTGSISKEEISITFSDDNSLFDCIYSSKYSYFTHLPIGQSVCGLNLEISETTLDNIHEYLKSNVLNEGKASDLDTQPIEFKLTSIKDISIYISANSTDDIISENSFLVIKSNDKYKKIKTDRNNRYYIEFNRNQEPVALVLYNGAVKKLDYDNLKKFITE